jgi:hypothetical protein
MKSFFKKLSLVLVAAMVITLIPAQSAKAAPTPLAIGLNETDAKAGKGISIEVGETSAKLGFWGVTNYNVAGANTKKWSTSDKTVATVNDGKVTGVKAGTATISLTLTNNNIDYAGAVTVTVKAKASTTTTTGNVSVKQTAYNAVEVSFADAAAAEAAKDGIKIERVKTSAKGAFYLNVNATKSIDSTKKNVVTLTGLADGSTYQITVPGVAKAFVLTMSVGSAAAVVLEYPVVYIGAGTNITGGNIKNPTVVPTTKVVDANGIVINFKASDIKYTTDRTKNQYVNFTANNGKIKFSNINGQCYVKATYTFKDAAGAQQTLTDETVVTPVAYQAPNLQGFVEQICLTTESDPKKVKYPGTYDFKGTLSVGQLAYIAYYFETPDGDKYTGTNVQNTVKKDGIEVASAKEYVYYFEKDDASANVVSLYKATNTTQVRGWNEGTERICLYKQIGTKADPLSDTLVGVIDITVQPEPYVFDMNLSETSLDGFENGLKTSEEITYSLVDQYGDKIKGELVATDANGGSVSSWVTITKTDDYKGKIKFDFATLQKTTETKDVIIKVKNQTENEMYETVSVTVDHIDENSSDIGYELIVSDKVLKNKDLQDTTGITNIGITFEVAETRDGNRLKKVPFAVICDEDLDVATSTLGANVLYLVLTDLDSRVVTKDAAGNFATTANAATAMSFTFDAFPNTATDLGEKLITGTFNAQLFRAKSVTAGDFDTENEVEVSLTNEVELLVVSSNTYGLKKDGDKAVLNKSVEVWIDKDKKGTIGASNETAYFNLIEEIVGELYAWYDMDSNGKVAGAAADTTSTEIKQIKDLAGYSLVSAKYVPGANNDEVFIKSVVIEFTPGSTGVVATQTITVNRKFAH